MSSNDDVNSLEVKHLRNMILFGLIFAVLFFGLALGVSALMKMSAVNQLTSSMLFKVMGYHNVSVILTASGLSMFGMASVFTWVMIIIGFTIGAVLGWIKKV